MQQYSRFIMLAGGILALFSFVLPWEGSYSGVEFANMGFNFITLVFFASLVIIGASLVLNRHKPLKVRVSRVIIAISSCIGLCCFVVMFFGESLDVEIGGMWFNAIRYGAFLNAIGFVLAIFGVLDYPETEDGLESNDEQENEKNHEGDEE